MHINANTASREELVALRGINARTANAIIRRRPFTAIEDLLSIPGIRPPTLERLKQQGLFVGQLPRVPGGDNGHRSFKIALPGFTAEASLYQATYHYWTDLGMIFIAL